MINRIVPIASPFLNYFRLSDRFWTPTHLELGTCYRPQQKKISKDFLLPGLKFLDYNADCVLVRFQSTTGSRSIHLGEFRAEKKDLR